MSKRIKPALSVPIINSIQDADSTLAKIAALGRNIQFIETGMNDDIAKVKLEASEKAEPFRQEMAALVDSLQRYALYHKAELFKGRRTLDLTFGSFGFRASTVLKTVGKTTWERVLEKLRDLGLEKCIRVKEEVDEERVKGLGEDQLKALGCKLAQLDTFFCEPCEQELAPDFGNGGGPGEAA